MPSFQDRKSVGDAHEHRVAQELLLRGWDVNTWGQAILNAAVRSALRGTNSSLRWTPDLVAAKGEQVFLIDCKHRMTSRTTHRHAVEQAAVMAHLQLAAWSQLPVCYVFDNLEILTPHDILMTGRAGPRSVNGSGSAYYLIPTTRSFPFDEVFGAEPRHHAKSEAA
ncbi:hypothetical protein G7Z12_37670 [Streptomyces sp. ID38640]|uniref:hypothetical protein n=1 Tax=Streptomyces sp. ID38640 TaxID=1265399 RepID=UPI00140EAB44|nr:hypothetical protein [Streptomyces sp. ID38640]QIK10948.1 hypothetical protein G7Z12_00070 [Streptomyces sp. ID38640]QIK11833.1 hypothetical protein G7Z12_37365 [Streptomyces sp. ID38640]QIK11842.1 hypothetical protein G7Z12_37670 [Streptomyces sp. ID38640]